MNSCGYFGCSNENKAVFIQVPNIWAAEQVLNVILHAGCIWKILLYYLRYI
jgi:hypothetical protein